jgi:NADPH:quinone reductase-like Zn-dependent oxidoreductase
LPVSASLHLCRWGLYESAHEFVGYPIVPGFDVAGVVERVGSNVKDLQVGDRAFGCTFFGAYSSRILIPATQLRKIPDRLSTVEAASLPAVSLTALYALFLAGHFPLASKFRRKGILIHSAAGGVGSMLVQLSRLLGLSPVVGVVGRTAKVEAAQALGCHVVIDKSQENLWEAARAACPDGYAAVMDSNGVSTIQESYNHLSMTGRLIVYGFHSNLPMGRDMLSPLEWVGMALKQQRMPQFDHGFGQQVRPRLQFVIFRRGARSPGGFL